MPRPCRLFLFDLDGTLVDSREDIARAVNAVLMKVGQNPLSMSDVLRFVGDGIEILMQRALRAATGREPDASQVGACVDLMIQEYEHHLFDASRLYPGVRETLDALALGKDGADNQQAGGAGPARTRGVRSGPSFFRGDGRRQPAATQAGPGAPPGGDGPLWRASIRNGDGGGQPHRHSCRESRRSDTCGVSGGFRGREELQAAGSDVIIDEFSELLRHFSAPST